MDKPITVLRQEFMENLVKLCNESGLPAFVKFDILKGLCNAVCQQVDTEYQRDLNAYNKESTEEIAEVNNKSHTGGVKTDG